MTHEITVKSGGDMRKAHQDIIREQTETQLRMEGVMYDRCDQAWRDQYGCLDENRREDKW